MNRLKISIGLLIFALMPVIVFAKSSLECHKSRGFMVIERRNIDAVSTDFLVKPIREDRLSNSCEYNVQPGDFEIPNETAEYFLGLHDYLLILDSGTGPSPRGFIIWDIAKRHKVYQGSYSEPITLAAEALLFWVESAPTSEKNCPQKSKWQANGLGAAFETQIKLSLQDFKINKLTNTRCSPRQ
jgi:hypothetical protein